MIGLAAPLVLPYTADDWAHFIALHALGAFALAWVGGITFMLTMTITVLQLREVGPCDCDCGVLKGNCMCWYLDGSA
jgi:hypothetical protein